MNVNWGLAGGAKGNKADERQKPRRKYRDRLTPIECSEKRLHNHPNPCHIFSLATVLQKTQDEY